MEFNLIQITFVTGEMGLHQIGVILTILLVMVLIGCLDSVLGKLCFKTMVYLAVESASFLLLYFHNHFLNCYFEGYYHT